jgi:hypothetical protein
MKATDIFVDTNTFIQQSQQVKGGASAASIARRLAKVEAQNVELERNLERARDFAKRCRQVLTDNAATDNAATDNFGIQDRLNLEDAQHKARKMEHELVRVLEDNTRLVASNARLEEKLHGFKKDMEGREHRFRRVESCYAPRIQVVEAAVASSRAAVNALRMDVELMSGMLSKTSIQSEGHASAAHSVGEERDRLASKLCAQIKTVVQLRRECARKDAIIKECLNARQDLVVGSEKSKTRALDTSSILTRITVELDSSKKRATFLEGRLQEEVARSAGWEARESKLQARVDELTARIEWHASQRRESDVAVEEKMVDFKRRESVKAMESAGKMQKKVVELERTQAIMERMLQAEEQKVQDLERQIQDPEGCEEGGGAGGGEGENMNAMLGDADVNRVSGNYATRGITGGQSLGERAKRGF